MELVGDTWQREVHAAEPLVTPNPFQVEIAIGKLHKGMDQILAEFIQAEGRTLCSDIHKFTNSVCNEDLPQQGKKSVTIFIYKKRLNLQYISKHITDSNFKQNFTEFFLSLLTPYVNKTVDNQCGQFS
jgi:hypothetical protein